MFAPYGGWWLLLIYAPYFLRVRFVLGDKSLPMFLPAARSSAFSSWYCSTDVAAVPLVGKNSMEHIMQSSALSHFVFSSAPSGSLDLSRTSNVFILERPANIRTFFAQSR